MKIIRTEKIILNGEKRLGLHFDPEDFSFVSLIIKLPDCRWSPGIHSWHISFREDYLSFLNKTCPDPLLFIDVTPDMIRKYHEGIPADKRVIMDKSDPELKQVLNYLIMMGYEIIFKDESSETRERNPERGDVCRLIRHFRNEMSERHYCERTIGLYLTNVKRYLYHCGSDNIVNTERINSYINDMSMTGCYSRSYQNQVINSIKLFFRLVYKRKIGKAELIRPRRGQPAPTVLSEKEIGDLITSVSNFKHRTILSILYHTGIRPSELRELSLNDVDFKSGKIQIKGSAGNQFRNIRLSHELEKLLLSYISQYLPERYLFEGKKGKPYSVRCLQKIFHSALKKANVSRNASIYSLRHSYAARRLESGTDLKNLQLLLGHASSFPAAVYSRMLNNS